jgi:hypothetical protein
MTPGEFATSHGLVKRLHRTTLIWQVVLYERPVA